MIHQLLIRRINNKKIETMTISNYNGIYHKVDSDYCNMIYIGAIGKKFITRIKKHQINMKNDTKENKKEITNYKTESNA